VTPLGSWYRDHGRHDLPWRQTRDRWAILVSEVMLHQTPVGRVLPAWSTFLERFPTPAATQAAGPGAVIEAWGRLGYPRRARRLWEAADRIARNGWPADLTELAGVGRYTAAAVAALADDTDALGVEVNIRRVCERTAGARLGERAAERRAEELTAGLSGRDRLLALMDLGALVCTSRLPRCPECPLRPGCASRGPLAEETRHRQARYEGSFRQRRGAVLARLRAGGAPTAELDGEALDSLIVDGLAEVTRGRAHLPRSPGSSPGGRAPRR
jgi:A/G-specific adenine glycosylase